MGEKHWCVHEVGVLKVRSITMSIYLRYKYIGGKVEVTMYNFIKCTEL